MGNDAINYVSETILNGQPCMHSFAHQLADHIVSKKFDGYRLTHKKGFLSATFYFQKVLRDGSYFYLTKYDKRINIGTVYYDAETKIMTFCVEHKKRKFHSEKKHSDCFYIQNEIFEYLRDCDFVQIEAKEKISDRKVLAVYKIKKSDALKYGFVVTSSERAECFYIPIAKFKKEIKNRRITRENFRRKK